MSEVREAAEDFLSEYPDTEDALSEIVALDQNDVWSFEDVPLDSGIFGEFVSRGLAEQVDGGYRLVDRQAVIVALEGDTDGAGSNATTKSRLDTDISVGLPTLKRLLPEQPSRVFGAIGASFLLLIGLRMLAYPTVFRGDNVVLLANDPYYYRYWVEQLLAQPNGSLQTLSTLPDAVANGEPLMVATLWFIARLFGGDAGAAGNVLAWYPVGSTLVVGSVSYLLGTRLFADRRVGIAAVVMLALIPAHAYRSSVGFADHHAFDYLWLALTMLILVVLTQRRDRHDWRSWAFAGGLGVTVAGQVLAWQAGPLLLLPIGGYVVLLSLLDCRADRSSVRLTLPVLAGLAFGAALTYVVHQILGWHTSAVAATPLLLFIGCLGALGLAELARRLGTSPLYLAAAELAFSIGGVGILWYVDVAVTSSLSRGIDFLLRPSSIAEETSILSGDLGSIFGPALLFGFILFLALPYLGWLMIQLYRDRGADPVLIVPTVYSWFFLGLVTIQIRFAGELSIAIAPIAGVGFIHFLSWIDLARPPVSLSGADSAQSSDYTADPAAPSFEIPDRRGVFALGAAFLLVSSLSFMMIPVKTNQLTIPDDRYQASLWMAEHAADQNWEYPENYVFSRWSWNRMYNYFVNGESPSYGYAKGNYADFLASSAGAEWYQRLRDRTGFIVTEDLPQVSSTPAAESLYNRLHTDYGSGSDTTTGLAHYRAVYVSEDRSLKVFTLVPGAQLAGTASSNTEVTVTTRQSVSGVEFTYSRTIETDATGAYSVTVPYPGEYVVNGTRVRVSETAVQQNQTISVSTLG
ncbi:dolichyl-diphosphooligosaccharide--protein glycosyltransferase [Haloplanus vescus]|uniref:dolichyl-phosphooligosaccharide-protein glycotransferase n=1 Tax=Haloplanus vescus TaxID=555874 RepID=A0A1H3XJH4_9EURY|nr:STT3 domain-containing protein [Haloplanus vescus]SDZ98762.1 dolichyl-diphosphooligosaccharide--protein glycosyltransferase [Haloplanus vescus]